MMQLSLLVFSALLAVGAFGLDQQPHHSDRKLKEFMYHGDRDYEGCDESCWFVSSLEDSHERVRNQ